MTTLNRQRNEKSWLPSLFTAASLLFSFEVSWSQEKLFIPSHPMPHAPLFVDIHGCLSSPEAHDASSRLTEEAEEHGFYVYFPTMDNPDTQKGCFDFYSENSEFSAEKDASKIIHRIGEIQSEYDIDAHKTFVMGMSAGASMTSLLASCYPDIFAGAAIHSGMAYGLASNWQNALAIAALGPYTLPLPRRQNCDPRAFTGKIFLIHGSRDQVMSPSHYNLLKSDYLEQYTETQNAVINPRAYQFPYIHEKFYDQTHQLMGQGIFVLGMNHEWSGGPPRLPFAPRGPKVTPMIVHFFLEGR